MEFVESKQESPDLVGESEGGAKLNDGDVEDCQWVLVELRVPQDSLDAHLDNGR